MTEADVIQPSASIASTGKGLRYIQNWVYAYSGEIAVNNVEGTLIEARSASGIIVGHFQQQYFGGSSDNYKWRIYFNDQAIAAVQEPGITTAVGNTFFQINLIIPPFTLIKITAQNVTDTSSNDMGAILTGRVYGAT